MWLIKFYIGTVFFYFIVLTATKYFFKECLIERGIIRKSSFIKSIINSFALCLIPIIRLFMIIIIIILCFIPKEKLDEIKRGDEK